MSKDPAPTRTKLGDILLRLHLVTEEQVHAALAHQSKTGRLFGESLLDLGAVGEDDLSWALSSQLGFSFVAVTHDMADAETVARFPADFLRRHAVLPLVSSEGTLSVVLADPTDEATVARLRRMSGCDLDIAVGTPTAIRRALEALTGATAAVAGETTAEDKAHATLASPGLGKLLERALAEEADFVHLDPDGDRVRVRFRVQQEIREAGWFDPRAHEELLDGLGMWLGAAEDILPGVRRWSGDGEGEALLPFRALAVTGKAGTSLTLILHSGSGVEKVAAGFEEEWNRVTPLLGSARGLVLGAAPRPQEREQLLARIVGQLHVSGREAWVLAPEHLKFPVGTLRFQPSGDGTTLRAFCGLPGVDVVAGTLSSLDGVDGLARAASQDRLVVAVLPGCSSLEILSRVLEAGVSPTQLSGCLLAVIAQRIVSGGKQDVPQAVSEVLFGDLPLRRALQNGGKMDDLRSAAREQKLLEIAGRLRGVKGVPKNVLEDLERHRYLEDAA